MKLEMIHFCKIITPFCLILACGSPKSEAAAEAEKAPEIRVPVSAAPLVRRNLTDLLDLNATTIYRRKENIRATATGFLHGLNLRLGDPLAAGAFFCNITTKEQTALKDLANQPGYEALREPFTIRSGAGGILTAINVQEGDYVAEGDVLATVAQPATLALSLNVPFEYQRFINVGKAVIAILPDGRQVAGQIVAAMPTIDVASQTQAFFVKIPTTNLPENLNVMVRIATGQRVNALCAPIAAVQTDEMQREFWVMKIIGDSMAVRVEVTAGLRADSIQEVRSPLLLEADRVVSQGAFGLGDSVRIKILEKEN